MTTQKIDSTLRASGEAPQTEGASSSTAALVALLRDVEGQTLAPGTAALVAELTEALRKEPGRAAARIARVQLSAENEFHEGFVNGVLDISDRLRRAGEKASVEVTFPGAGEMNIRVIGDANGAIEREIEELARGAVNVAWNAGTAGAARTA